MRRQVGTHVGTSAGGGSRVGFKGRFKQGCLGRGLLHCRYVHGCEGQSSMVCYDTPTHRTNLLLSGNRKPKQGFAT